MEDSQPILQVLEQVVHGRFDTERVQPERKRTRLTLALGIEIFDNAVILLLFFVEWCETRPGVEQISGEREVKSWITRDECRRCEILAATDLVRVF